MDLAAVCSFLRGLGDLLFVLPFCLLLVYVSKKAVEKAQWNMHVVYYRDHGLAHASFGNQNFGKGKGTDPQGELCVCQQSPFLF